MYDVIVAIIIINIVGTVCLFGQRIIWGKVDLEDIARIAQPAVVGSRDSPARCLSEFLISKTESKNNTHSFLT